MMLWIILTIMTSAAAVWMTLPLLRRLEDRGASAGHNIAVYRDQLAEVKREAADGLIDADQAQAARLEIERRLLAADRQQGARVRTFSLGERHFAVVAVGGIVVLGATILYALGGRPDLPGVRREANTTATGSAGQSAAALQGGAATQGAAPQPSAGLASVDELIQRLVDRLKSSPDNAEGWRMLGWSYFGVERYADAAEAYAKAVALSPNVASIRAAQGESVVRAANGLVGAEAQRIFEATLAIDPKDPRARFFKGLAKEQAGNKREAFDDWTALLQDAGPDADWAEDLKARVAALGSELSVNATGQAPAAGTATQQEKTATGGILGALQQDYAARQPAPERGPTAADVRAADTMAPADRSAMIRGMVEGLAQRLERSPRDADGWIQLIRSRKVLGETDAASIALAKALKIFSDAPEDLARIADAARGLGVVP
jgi:cytochrome c-type biogenesis protein CcmH